MWIAIHVGLSFYPPLTPIDNEDNLVFRNSFIITNGKIEFICNP